MPFDRHWAVSHAASKFDPAKPGWAVCANFNIGARDPRLTAIEATFDEGEKRLTLSHPDRPDVTFRPDIAAESWRFLDWVEPLIAQDRPRPTAVVSAPERGMTDTDYPSISLNSLTSHRAFEDLAGQEISPKRWRGNLWLDGLEPWAEFDWVGKTIRIGAVELAVQEPIRRCTMTTSNPATGLRDFDTLALLNGGFGHQDFGVYAEVVTGGEIKLGDQLTVLG